MYNSYIMADKVMVIYNIDTYENANNKFIKNKGIVVDDIDEMKEYLKSNCGYHFRIHKNTQYIFFGDLDNYVHGIKNFIKLLQAFLKTKYNLKFTENEFMYTQNNENKNSYHYSIPKWNLKTEKLKEIHTNFYTTYKKELSKLDSNGKCIDTTIYSEHWFRCPNQKKGKSSSDTSKHEIKYGPLEDFVIYYIPKNSVDINNVEYIQEAAKKQIKKTIEKELKNNKNTELVEYNTSNVNKIDKENMFSSTMTQPTVYKKMFDECYKEYRFNEYESWLSVGMALKNSNLDEKTALDLFDYFSAKGSKYDGYLELEKKFKTFIKKKTHLI